MNSQFKKHSVLKDYVRDSEETNRFRKKKKQKEMITSLFRGFIILTAVILIALIVSFFLER
jgi:hypothetical protein